MNPSDDVTRIGTAERDAAQNALAEHMRAGRLDPTEYSERAEAVALARTPAALAPLFADLPAPGPFASTRVDLGKPAADRDGAGRVLESGSPNGGPDHAAGGEGAADDHGWNERLRPLGGHAGARLVAIAPIVALIVALSTGFWWAFFLVPLAGMVVWGDPRAHRYWRHGGCGYPAGYRHPGDRC